MRDIKEFCKSFLVPNEIQVKSKSDTEFTVVFEPFERGFGLTVGHALRRILISQMPGAAITEVKIDGVLHEYSTVSGVREDVIAILLNLKEVALKLDDFGSAVGKISKEGPCVVTAGDITADRNIEIANPDYVIAQVEKGGKLDMVLQITSGVGYKPVTTRKAEGESNQSIGHLQLDASYTPVRKVSYEVENARVGSRTDLDRLVVHLSTNGTISPEEAVRCAATILQSQLKSFAVLDLEPVTQKEDVRGDIDPILYKRICDLNQLSVRAENCLKAEGICYIGDLVQRSETELLKMPNLGKKSLEEIRELLSNYRLDLGQSIKGWVSPTDESDPLAGR